MGKMNSVWKATFADLTVVITSERAICSHLGMRKQCCVMSWQDFLCFLFPALAACRWVGCAAEQPMWPLTVGGEAR